MNSRGLVIIALALLSVGSAREISESCISSGSGTLKMNTPFFEGPKNFDVVFIANGGAGCPGPDHPVIKVESNFPKGAWIQLVTINIQPEHRGFGWQLSQIPGKWTFVDVSPQNRKQKSIFYNRQPTFFDNPKSTVTEPYRQLSAYVWQARLFFVQVHGNHVKSLGGIKWGYATPFGGGETMSFVPKALKNKDWRAAASTLKKLAPSLVFHTD